MKCFILSTLLLVFLTAPQLCTAGANEDRGLAIAMEADRRTSGFGDYQVAMTMILRSKAGKESIRAIRSRVRETVDDGDKSLTIFDSPGDVRGTAMLTITHKEGDDDQWLYLPALKRVKRLSSADKSGSFMGSEFAYEDLASREVEKYGYHFVSEEKFRNQDCFVLELTPKDTKNSGYRRIVSWLDQDHYRVQKEEYYDPRGRLLKTLTLREYHRYLDDHWRPQLLLMVNHQNGRQTELQFGDYRFHTGLTDGDFNKSSLQRVR